MHERIGGIGFYISKHRIEGNTFPICLEFRPSSNAVQIGGEGLGGQLARKRFPIPSSQNIGAFVDRKFPLVLAARVESVLADKTGKSVVRYCPGGSFAPAGLRRPEKPRETISMALLPIERSVPLRGALAVQWSRTASDKNHVRRSVSSIQLSIKLAVGDIVVFFADLV